jgi:BMFP domain-containing protein YqiC
MDPKIIDDMAQKLAGSLPPGVQGFQHEVEKNLRAALEAMLSKLNMVNREEFDVQSAVLARTRAKLDALEKQVAELEKNRN